MSDQTRKPRIFRLDDPKVSIASGDEPGPSRGRGGIIVTPEPDFVEAELLAVDPARPRRSRWGLIFWSGAGLLVTTAAGLAVTRLIEDLFTYSGWLGWLGAVVAAVTALALVVILFRELAALWRLEKIEAMHERAIAAVASDDREAARSLVRELLDLYGRDPATARARASLETTMRDIVDGADLIGVTEMELMGPLDARARAVISEAAKRVSVVTAVSPRALFDILFVASETLRMVRRLAAIYGGRPGGLGLLRLLRHALGNLAITGGMAAGESLISEIVGAGVASRISAKLGEGVLNGILISRFGIAAMATTRPLPFDRLPRPSVRDVAGGLFTRERKNGKGQQNEAQAEDTAS